MAVLTENEAHARAEAAVRAYCGWHIAPAEDTTLTLDGPGSSVLLLPSLHVTAVASVTERGILVDPSAYTWSESGVVKRAAGSTWSGAWGGGWTDALRGVEVAFTHGYDEWPLDVLAIVDRLASRAVEGSASGGMLVQVGAVSYATGEDGLPVTGAIGALERSSLSRYKLPPRP